MLTGAIIGAFIGVLVWLVGFAVASTSKAAGRPFPAKSQACSTALSPPDVLNAVRSAVREPYRLDESGTTDDTIVLTMAPTLAHYGFFLPVRARSQPDGSTLVEVGCMSRGFLPAPVPEAKHREALEMVKAAVRGS